MVSLKVDHMPDGDDIVITGISGQFPSALNIDEFRDKLFNKEDLIETRKEFFWQNDKLDVTNKVGLVGDVNKFDAAFYGMHTNVAEVCDAMCRKLLERAFEAVVDAGINPSTMSGTNTAVFTGSMISESENIVAHSVLKYRYGMLGHCRAMMSNRISYWLDVSGTSVSIVTMETCGFEALTAAYQEMKQGRCDAAVVGATNLVYTPEMVYHYKELGLLSKSGKCCPFDAEADGYLESDGIVVMLLQKAKDAKRIYATLVNTDIAHFGERSGYFIDPHGDALADLMEKFYNSCGVDPSRIFYLETEGDGVKRHDEEEMKAVDKVLTKNRTTPLLIGSVKSNMGHSHGASNFTAMAKVLIAMEKRAIPPNLHFTKPSPNIPALIENRVKVVTDVTPWNGGLAALNAFSISGTYAHVLLKSFDKNKEENTHADGSPRLLVVSSRTEAALKEIMDKLHSMPVDIEFIRLLHDVHSFNITNHMYRGYTIVPPESENPIQEIQRYDQTSRPVWFVFSGMGSQWNTMGVDLMKLPVCGAAIEKCHAILEKEGVDLKHIITTEDSSVYDNILYSFVGIAAIQIALVDMLNALGIKADGMVGHSVGELGCAYADGCLSLEEMILSAYYRGKASLQAELIPGFMAAVGLGYDQVKSMLPPEIDVACHNSSSSSTLSGPAEIVKEYVAKLQEQNIFARAVNVANIAYHSRYIQPAAPFLLEYLQSLVPNPKKRSDRWICSSLPEEKWDTSLAQYCSAEYLTNNLLSPVLFEEASRHIPKNAIVIEIAPHGLLQAILRRSLSAECTNIPLTQRGQGLLFTLAALGKLYCAGLTPQLKELYPPVQLPVSRGTPSISPLVRWDHSFSYLTVSDLLQTVREKSSGEKFVHLNLNKEEFRVYRDYAVNGRILFPVFGYLKLVWEILAGTKGVSMTNVPVVFENVKIFNHLQVERKESYTIYVLLQQGSGQFEISHEEMLLVTGKAYVPDSVSAMFVREVPVPPGDIELTRDVVYGQLELQGYDYNGLFQGIENLSTGKLGCVAKIRKIEDWVVFGEVLLQLVIMQSLKNNQEQYLPVKLQRVIIDPSKHETGCQEMEAIYNHPMNVLYCGGLEMHNVKLATFSLLKNPHDEQIMKKLKFVSYSNLKLQNMKEFIAFSMHCTLENSTRPVASVAVIDISIVEVIKSLIPHYPQMKMNIETKYVKNGKSYDLVIVTKKEELESGISIINNNGGFLLVQIKNNSWQVLSDLTILAEQEFGNTKFLLYKKVEVKNGHSPCILHLSGDMSTWLQQIRNAESCHQLYAVAQLEVQGMEIVSYFLQQMNGELRRENMRYVFILDKKAPRFSISESMYQKYLSEKDLVLNVYYNGEWGTFCFLPLDTTVPTDDCELELPIHTSLEKINMSFLGLNYKNMSVFDNGKLPQTGKIALGAVDFTGHLESGHRVMGVAMFDQETRKLSSNQNLMWEVPNSWSLEEAATVPLAYTIAYYALVIKGKMKSGESVLVHAGWSSIGQAAITLALHYNCTVFTSVANQEQKIFLKQKFPQLLDEHIFNSNDVGFELYILKNCIGTTFDLIVLNKSRGKGVNIILNCLSGPMLKASVRSLAPFGRFLELLEPDIITNQTVGMEVFVKSATLCGISTQNLVALTPEWKEALHIGVQDLIHRGVVKPLQYTTYSKQHAKEALRSFADVNNPVKVIVSLTKSTSETVPKKNSFCSSRSYYLVVGSAIDEGLHMAEWLAMQGVRQIVIAVKNKELSKCAEQRIELLDLHHNTRVILLRGCVMNPNNGISQVVEKASSIFTGFLEGLFILPLESPESENKYTTSVVANLDVATRGINTLKYFVCLFMKNSWSVCERRYREGLPALSVFWTQNKEEKVNLRQYLKALNKIISVRINAPIVLVADEENDVDEEVQDDTPPLDTFLPNSVNAVISLGKDLESDSSWLLEIPSLSPGYGKVKNVPPVFIIPGLQGPPTEYLRPLARKLMYPVLCTRIVDCKNTITDIAAHLVKCIQNVESSGPYNIVGISWGGAVTLELARLLEAEGHKVRVLLVDGAPKTIQAAAQQLKKDGNLDTNLVSALLQTKVKLNSSNKWSEVLNEALNSIPSVLHSNLKTAMVMLHNSLNLLFDYKPSGDLFKGEVSLVRPSTASEDDNCGLDHFCKQKVSIHIVEGNHETLLWNPETARIINDFII